GFYHCLNTTTEVPGQAGAVLIRAIEPLQGTDIMLRNRHLPKNSRPESITNGPGKLTRALDISLRLNGLDLTKGNELYVCETSHSKPPSVEASRRVGVSQASQTPWRFFISQSKFVSRPKFSQERKWWT
ncbi:MAG: DNA-3-methyladenine glycosylase, partial [Thaumarchaeota archaeon]|nr:DNA-3-methyladenine glycosylase [Nitrososphaerota archaeon]